MENKFEYISIWTLSYDDARKAAEFVAEQTQKVSALLPYGAEGCSVWPSGSDVYSKPEIKFWFDEA